MDDQKAAIDSKINQILKNIGSEDEVRKEFRRSKIMIVGEGCAGKTAFANSIIGKKFEETESTVGINTFLCSVTHAAFSKGEWKECDKIEKEYENAIAEHLSFMKEVDIEDDDLTQHESSQIVRKKDSNGRDTRMEGKFSALKSDDYAVDHQDGEGFSHSKDDEREEDGAALDHSKGDSTTDGIVQSSSAKVDKDMIVKYLDHSKDDSITDGIDQSAQVDEDMIVKYLANHVEIGANILISIFDYGGQTVFNVSL
jgi:GTPase SAR1 family protein